ncbi:anthrax toxin lethal factor-related metalloendopeptidase [Butyrivibrio fibrisolvens]|uniref:anthrax toxin lethal factor-related metalloendopeptidase n=1 Tax=Butyrivibrio fibrisolvens TaxID=831 RepID=UPI0003B42E39|nr:hypothetical protein [Butyrivibrio fibrisolvens]
MKRSFSVILLMVLIFLQCSSKVYAEPKEMSDGQLFDAQFNADTYPDVKEAFGYNEVLLYEHYLTCGKAEGRLPYAGAAPTEVVPVTTDLVVTNIDQTQAVFEEIQLGYNALPQNVKNYFNTKNITIYSCSRDYIGTVNTRKSLGCTPMSCYLDENGKMTSFSANVYVCGSTNSFMPPRYTLYHELGHILDYILGCSNGYRTYYSSTWEGWTELVPYSPTQVYDAKEAFAEAFAAYFERPEKMKQIAPNAYAYIENFIINMK